MSDAPTGEVLDLVSVHEHACGIRSSDHEVVCWGGGYAPPTDVAFDEVSVGGTHVCGIRSGDGEVVCWGNNDYGQVSDAPSGIAFESVSAGGDLGEAHNCAVRASDHEVICWGYDSDGQVSDAPVGLAFDSVSAGHHHTCGIRSDDKTLTCWGAMVWNPR